MSMEDLVSLRFYLAAPALDPANVAVLRQQLGSRHAARRSFAPDCSSRVGS